MTTDEALLVLEQASGRNREGLDAFESSPDPVLRLARLAWIAVEEDYDYRHLLRNEVVALTKEHLRRQK